MREVHHPSGTVFPNALISASLIVGYLFVGGGDRMRASTSAAATLPNADTT